MSGKGKNSGHSLPGRPLVALVAILAGWMGGRAVTWEETAVAASSWGEESSSLGVAPYFTLDPRIGPQSFGEMGLSFSSERDLAGESAYDQRIAAHNYRSALGGMAHQQWGGLPIPRIVRGELRGQDIVAKGYSMQNFSLSGSIRHLSNEFAQVDPGQRFFAPEVPSQPNTSSLPQARTQAVVPTAPPVVSKRWSADAWALLRDQGTGQPLGVLPATYGGSQAGAILRYHVKSEDTHRLSAYMRSTSSMGVISETSAALGLSGRPLPKVPVLAAVEGRVTEFAGEYRVQPAVMAITELPWFTLPARFRGEAYMQGGYIGGGFETLFADGQFRADHSVIQRGPVELRLGAGLWGGAQKHASRLDVGPSASISLPLGSQRQGRIGMDWRVRIGGNAVPETGPALTLSAGF